MVIADHSKKAVIRIIEGVAAILMVTICFLLFSDLVELIFPTSLIRPQLPGWSQNSALPIEADWRRLLIEKNGAQSSLDAKGHLAAQVAQVTNDLKYKRATSVAWETGREGMALFDHDSVQTLDHSSAWIQFDRNSAIQLGERTLITIQHFEQDLVLNDQRSLLLLLEGSLRSRIAGPGNMTDISLKTPGAMIHMHSNATPAEARVVVDKDKSTTIAVYQGTAQITVKGEHTHINANQAVNVPVDGPPSGPLPLPHRVVIDMPQDGKQFIDDSRPVKIVFKWQDQGPAIRYHFMLAKDNDFSHIVEDKSLSSNHRTLSGAKPGIYYWRVSAVAGDVEGQFSSTNRFYVISQLPPVVLSPDQPPEQIYYRDQVPKLLFAWNGPGGSSVYRWQLAHDPAFVNLVEQMPVRSNRLTYQGLAPGTYYWRVGSTPNGPQSVQYSNIRRLEVIQDSDPPTLQVRFPATTDTTTPYVISGITEPGAKVYVGGFQTDVAGDGRFNYTLQLKPGKNVIAVAAVDSANNVTSRSEIIYCHDGE